MNLTESVLQHTLLGPLSKLDSLAMRSQTSMAKIFNERKKERRKDPHHNKETFSSNHLIEVQTCNSISAKERSPWTKSIYVSIIAYHFSSIQIMRNLTSRKLFFLTRFHMSGQIHLQVALAPHSSLWLDWPLEPPIPPSSPPCLFLSSPSFRPLNKP